MVGRWRESLTTKARNVARNSNPTKGNNETEQEAEGKGKMTLPLPAKLSRIDLLVIDEWAMGALKRMGAS